MAPHRTAPHCTAEYSAPTQPEGGSACRDTLTMLDTCDCILHCRLVNWSVWCHCHLYWYWYCPGTVTVTEYLSSKQSCCLSYNLTHDNCFCTYSGCLQPRCICTLNCTTYVRVTCNPAHNRNRNRKAFHLENAADRDGWMKAYEEVKLAQGE